MSEMSVDDYIAELTGWQKDVAERLRKILVAAAPQAEEAIKWGQPVFSLQGPVAYFRAFENSVNLGFWRGAELDDPSGLLQGTGEKMRHMKITGIQDIDRANIVSFVEQAVELNLSEGDPTRAS